MSSDRFYVTTPIYYVNDVPHIGHAYTTILADVLARYHRLLDLPTHFLTGTDEHGQKVYEAACRAGITPQEQTDATVVRFQQLWDEIEISHDDFIRTTERRHTDVVQEILADLWQRGEIYEGEYEGWYSVSEERFYTEKDLIDGKSPEGKDVERIVEKNYFFRMSAYQQWLVQYIEEHPTFIQPDVRRNETLGYLRSPLGDLCISRPKARMPWGVELPWDADYVCYVWFDALVNYISAVGYRRDDEEFSRWWPASVHLIGKDILATHTVYWPTMLRAMGVDMPEQIFAHGWWLMGGAKMSKSEGNVADPMDMIGRYGPDSLRYFLMAEMTLGSDSTFTEELFVQRYNNDLANDLGNMVSRVTKMIGKHAGGRIPEPGADGEDEVRLQEAALSAVTAMEESLRGMRLDRGIAAAIGAVREANRYFDRKAPWKLAREGEQGQLGTVLYASAELLRIVSGLLFPVIPGKMTELRRTLGLPANRIEPHLASLRRWGELEAGSRIGEPAVLFPRIVPEKEDRPQEQAGAAGAPAARHGHREKETAAVEGLIDIQSFFRSKLRVAQVVAAEPIPKADRLLRLQIDLGDERRQILAGIAQYYRPEELVGRHIVVVANLQPATIRGEVSQGMLLAAKDGDRVRLIGPDGPVAPGAEVG